MTPQVEEGLQCSLQWQDGVDVAELVVYHKTKDTHLGRTAVVQLDGTLSHLGLLVELVPSKVDVSIAPVTYDYGWNK